MAITLDTLYAAQRFASERGLKTCELWLKPGALKALEAEVRERGWMYSGLAETITAPGVAYVLSMRVRDMPATMEADAALFDPEVNRSVEIFAERGEFRFTI